MIRPILALLPLVFAASNAAAAVGVPAGIAPQLRASANEAPDFMLRATGTHVYECRAGRGGYAWTFLNPDATLFDGTRSIGTHSTVGSWESSSDRSSTSGRVAATQPAGPGNLPWALYRTQSTTGAGLFNGVTSVQRVNTIGGAAPATGCTDTSLGTETRVAFTADFYFYKRRT
ncbi:MAG TPA: DUF3455 domain-containing protein [Usitatibacter sp.]|nr:DUF3455 domain-containing protein [Usitatibacter sp.]